jgi:hypothetical protein
MEYISEIFLIHGIKRIKVHGGFGHDVLVCDEWHQFATKGKCLPSKCQITGQYLAADPVDNQLSQCDKASSQHSHAAAHREETPYHNAMKAPAKAIKQ